MRAGWRVGIIVLLVVMLSLVGLAGWALGGWRGAAAAQELGGSQGPGRYGQEGLRVSGTAVVRAAPEVALLRVGYESRALRAREARMANDAVMKKVLAAMVKEGVARKDIQTVEYRLFPMWENWPRPTVRTHCWHVLHMVEVRVRKVETVAEVIDAASAAGADKMENVQFRVENLHKLRAEARKLAAKVAREKAQQLADLTGAKLGKVVALTDNSARLDYTPWYGWHAAANATAQATVDMSSEDATPDSVVSAGQVAVEAREEVVFALE